jgi:hypothetical protein
MRRRRIRIRIRRRVVEHTRGTIIHMFMRFDCDVPGILLLCDLKAAMRLDSSKDVCQCFNLHQLRFQCIGSSYMELVALRGCVCFCVSS